jgi:hypothetical protein
LKYHFDDTTPDEASTTHEFRLKAGPKGGLETALDFDRVRHVTETLETSGLKFRTPVAGWHAVGGETREAIQLRPLEGDTIKLKIDGTSHKADGVTVEFHQGAANDTVVRATGLQGPLALQRRDAEWVRNLTQHPRKIEEEPASIDGAAWRKTMT